MLAVIGVHGVLSYGVSERRRELGIRVALGAGRRQIAWLVVGEGMALAALGIAVGIAGATLASRALSSLLFGVGRDRSRRPTPPPRWASRRWPPSPASSPHGAPHVSIQRMLLRD